MVIIAHLLVNFQALEVHGRAGVGELVGLDDVDAVSMEKMRHRCHLHSMHSHERAHAGERKQKSREDKF